MNGGSDGRGPGVRARFQRVEHIEDEMTQSYMDYAMSVIIGRALPDVRDGLKPGQRRVLYAMFREGLLPSRSYSKCAGIVGEVLKKLPPARRRLGVRHPGAPRTGLQPASSVD